ncbi:hypothetical protein [Paenibacillus sp. RC67]|uniref:hypothetical protein n=1 Tax=Paenibacillus sp. RC67 TaxID=3039392 RepID=UPI0024AE0369|nr:hypothetical protein [Paenibacillus sp. RC67]
MQTRTRQRKFLRYVENKQKKAMNTSFGQSIIIVIMNKTCNTNFGVNSVAELSRKQTKKEKNISLINKLEGYFNQFKGIMFILFLLYASITSVIIWKNSDSIFMSLLLFVTIIPFPFFLKPKYITKNFFLLSSIVLFAIPISLSTLLLMFLFSISSHYISEYFSFYYLFSIPCFSIMIFLMFIKQEAFLDKAKVSLEYNNWIYQLILFGLVYYSNLLNDPKDFSVLIPVVNAEKLSQKNLSDVKELFSLFLQISSFPFLIANGILKSIVEHKVYKKAIPKGN